MSIFKNLVQDLCFTFNKKKMKSLRDRQIEVNTLNTQLINLNIELQDKTKEISNLKTQLIKALESHDFHQQNLHAKQNGFKSAFQYKMKIKKDISDNEQKQRDLAQQHEKYQRDLSKNQDELKKTNNALSFYNNLKINTIIGLITSILIICGFVILAIYPKFLENWTKYIIYSSILAILTTATTFATFFLDKDLSKRLELGKLNFFNYIFPILEITNILLICMPANSAKPYILIVSYLLLILSIIIILSRNEKFFKNEQYCFPLDFTMFNLPFVSFSAITVISVQMINNDTLALISKIMYLISVAFYIILFIWESIINRRAKKDFKQYIALILSIFLLLAFCFCAVLNFIPNFSEAIKIIGEVGGIISMFSPLYIGFKKMPNKNE